jgi:hypothetical protein
MSASSALARFFLSVLFGYVLLPHGAFLGQATAIRAQEPQTSLDETRARQLARMKAVASSIRLLADAERADSTVKLVGEPILKYTDNTRKNRESSLWIWSSGGRPVAVLGVEFYADPPMGPRWLFEIASLSENRIAAQHAPDLDWTAKAPGLAWTPVAGAGAPADSALRRLAQMKTILRSFTAHESAVIEGRIELRPLTSPLVRYAEPDAGILDGAIFAFANGTNPEVLVVVEAYAAKDSERRWRYALAQMTGAAVAVELDGKEIWQRGEADPPAIRDSYINGWLSAKPTEK